MRIWTLVVATILGAIVSDAVAQENASKSPAAIAVVDVGHILKNHPTMKGDIERIETQMKAADEEMTQQRDQILKLMEQLRENFVEGTPEYEAEEKRIAEMDTQFRLEVVKRRKEFDKSRAKVLYQVYSDIKLLVKYYCDNTGTQAILRVNGTREELDPNKPDTVQLLMSQEVLHYAANADITEWVLNGLNQRSAQRSGATNR